MCGASATADAPDDQSKTLLAGEKAVLFKLKNVTPDAADADARTVAVSFGPADARVEPTGLPLAKDIHLPRGFQSPSIANNLPFGVDRLKESVGKQVSVYLRAEASGLVLSTIATADD